MAELVVEHGERLTTPVVAAQLTTAAYMNRLLHHLQGRAISQEEAMEEVAAQFAEEWANLERVMDGVAPSLPDSEPASDKGATVLTFGPTRHQKSP